MILYLLPQTPLASSLGTEGERRGVTPVTTPALRAQATSCSPQHLLPPRGAPWSGSGWGLSWSLQWGGGGGAGNSAGLDLLLTGGLGRKFRLEKWESFYNISAFFPTSRNMFQMPVCMSTGDAQGQDLSPGPWVLLHSLIISTIIVIHTDVNTVHEQFL